MTMTHHYSPLDGPALRTEVYRDGPYARIMLSGDIDVDTSGQLGLAVADVLLDPPCEMVVDLRSVCFIDSSGIRALLQEHAHAADRACRLTVANPAPGVRRALEITGVLALLAEQADGHR
jgi:anti-sigma B factor antagonist